MSWRASGIGCWSGDGGTGCWSGVLKGTFAYRWRGGVVVVVRLGGIVRVWVEYGGYGVKMGGVIIHCKVGRRILFRGIVSGDGVCIAWVFGLGMGGNGIWMVDGVGRCGRGRIGLGLRGNVNQRRRKVGSGRRLEMRCVLYLYQWDYGMCMQVGI